MPIATQSSTARFVLKFDDQIGSAQQVAPTLSQTIEQDFFFLRRYMPFDEGKSPDFFETHPTNVVLINAGSKNALGLTAAAAKNIPNPGGAFNFKFDSFGTIWMNPFGATGLPLTPEFARFLFIAEMSEQLMSNYGWVGGNARGEALSRGMAEEFFPDAGYQLESISLAPWVNDWLNSSPRFDYINQTPGPIATNQSLGSDLDQNGFGCGLLFINYLRFQLGYTLEAVCQAGGTTLAEHYKNLTGRTDDPLVAMSDLLASHFDGFTYSLLSNNPFPLYDKTARVVELSSISVVKSVARLPVFLNPTAHVRPFPTCPEKDYRYHVASQAVTWTVTATVEGFGVPHFKWSINGAELSSPSGQRNEALTYAVPDPNHPQAPKEVTGNALFRWSYSDQFTREATQNVLTITNESFDGVYSLGISVSVQESLVEDTPTSTTGTLKFEAEKVVYEASYYSDGIKCAARFATEVPRLVQTIDTIPHGPDPSPTYDLSRIIRGVDDIRAELTVISHTNPRLGVEALKYAATRLQVEPGLLTGNRDVPR